MRNLYSEQKLTAVAKKTGFQKRNSKLKPSMFIDTILFKELDNGVVSLNDHCMALAQQYGIQIKKQSLAERFNKDAVSFLNELVDEQLNIQLSAKLNEDSLGEVLQHFNSVKVKDSTRFQIPKNLKDDYPGSTGAATGAGVHIQFEFDILSGHVNTLHHTDARTPDNKDILQTIDHVKSGDLILRDLGYFSSEALRYYNDQQAYFVSRPQAQMNLYKVDGLGKISYEEIYKDMKRNKLSYKETQVLTANGLVVRLITEMLPKKEATKRLEKIKKASKKKQARKRKSKSKVTRTNIKKASSESIARAHVNTFITNVPHDWLCASHVRNLYQLRWQIELRFKAWKSFYHLSAIKGMSLHRFECYLYASLLLIMINWEIAVNFHAILWNHTGKALSMLKFYKTTSRNIALLRTVVLEGQGEYLMFLYYLTHTVLSLEKRRKHNRSLEELLTLEY